MAWRSLEKVLAATKSPLPNNQNQNLDLASKVSFLAMWTTIATLLQLQTFRFLSDLLAGFHFKLKERRMQGRDNHLSVTDAGPFFCRTHYMNLSMGSYPDNFFLLLLSRPIHRLSSFSIRDGRSGALFRLVSMLIYVIWATIISVSP